MFTRTHARPAQEQVWPLLDRFDVRLRVEGHAVRSEVRLSFQCVLGEVTFAMAGKDAGLYWSMVAAASLPAEFAGMKANWYQWLEALFREGEF